MFNFLLLELLNSITLFNDYLSVAWKFAKRRSQTTPASNGGLDLTSYENKGYGLYNSSSNVCDKLDALDSTLNRVKQIKYNIPYRFVNL